MAIARRIADASAWLRPVVRREPLPRRPLVVAAVCLAAGCAVARPVGACASPTASLAVAWWWGAGFFLMAWWFAVRRGRGAAPAAALCLAIVCAGGAWSAARFDLFRVDDLAWRLGSDPSPVAIRGVVVESFRRLPSPTQDPARAAAIGPSSECVIAVEGVRSGRRWVPASGRAAVVVDGIPPATPVGTRVRVLGRGVRPRAAANPGEFDFRLRARSQRTLSVVRVDAAACTKILSRPRPWSPAAMLDRVRSVGVEVLRAHVGPERAGLASALLLGARESLPREDADDFLVTGTVHVLSISGLHVGLVAGGLFLAFRTLAVPRGAALVAVAVCTGAYMLVVRAETPVVRATLLVWLTCLASATGRRAAALNALAAAAIVVLVWRPADVFSTGAQLSFLSTAVLVGTAAALPVVAVPEDPIARLIEHARPAWERRLRRLAWRAWVLFVCGAAVWAATGPIVAARFHVVSPVGLVLNVLIAPLVAVAMAAGFLCLVVAPVSTLAAGWCGAACDTALGAIDACVGWGARLPGGHAWVCGPPGWWAVGWYVVIATSLAWLDPRLLRRGRTWGALAVAWCTVGLVAVGGQRLAGGWPAGLRAVVVDVGHGCGIVVRSPGGRCLLYDAGRLGAPGAARRAVAATLWSEGVSRIDVLVLSHADADHFNAVPELLERFAVGTVVVPPSLCRSASPAVADLLERLRRRGVPVRAMVSGDDFALDPLCRVRVLHPPAEPPNPDRADNESSLVLAVDSAGRRLLLTGDVEGAALARLVAGGPGTCDVLVAPHHGSRTSLPPVLAAATRPACVVVSGAGGRSWPEVRAAYAEAAGDGAVLLTGGAGALAVDLAADGLQVGRFSHGRWADGMAQAEAFGAGASSHVISPPATMSRSWLTTNAPSSRSTPDVKP